MCRSAARPQGRATRVARVAVVITRLPPALVDTLPPNSARAAHRGRPRAARRAGQASCTVCRIAPASTITVPESAADALDVVRALERDDDLAAGRHRAADQAGETALRHHPPGRGRGRLPACAKRRRSSVGAGRRGGLAAPAQPLQSQVFRHVAGRRRRRRRRLQRFQNGSGGGILVIHRLGAFGCVSGRTGSIGLAPFRGVRYVEVGPFSVNIRPSIQVVAISPMSSLRSTDERTAPRDPSSMACGWHGCVFALHRRRLRAMGWRSHAYSYPSLRGRLAGRRTGWRPSSRSWTGVR